MIKEPRRIEAPWGYQLIWAHTDKYVGKLLHITAGQRLSLQYHEIKEETIYVLSGILQVSDENGIVCELSPGEVYHVNPGQVHRFGAPWSNVEIMEVSTPELDDVVRLKDDYNR